MRKAVLLACLLAAGCGGKHAAAPAEPSQAAPSVVADGAWHGTTTRFQADSRHCPGPSLVDLAVVNNSFDYPWMRDVTVPVAIAPDGTLSGSNGDVTVSGKLVGQRMEGDAKNATCGLHFTLVKGL
jgi:hypothetical protein